MWYEAPSERVLTWNYAVLHVWGTIRQSTPTELNTELAEMGEAMSPGLSWWPANYNQAWRASRVQAIVGFVLDVKRVDAKFELNQHNSEGDGGGHFGSHCTR